MHRMAAARDRARRKRIHQNRIACGERAGVEREQTPTGPLETSLPNIFAAGDVRSGSVKRCAAAVGEGGMAVAGVQEALAASANRT